MNSNILLMKEFCRYVQTFLVKGSNTEPLNTHEICPKDVLSASTWTNILVAFKGIISSYLFPSLTQTISFFHFHLSFASSVSNDHNHGNCLQ